MSIAQQQQQLVRRKQAEIAAKKAAKAQKQSRWLTLGLIASGPALFSQLVPSAWSLLLRPLAYLWTPIARFGDIRIWGWPTYAFAIALTVTWLLYLKWDTDRRGSMR